MGKNFDIVVFDDGSDDGSIDIAKKLGFDWTVMSIEGYRENEKLIRDWAGGYTHINGDYYEKFE